MKTLSTVFFLFFLNSCSGPQDGVLASLITLGAYLSIFFISATIHFIIGIFKSKEPVNNKKKNKKRKNPSLVEQLKKDREFEEQEALKPYNPETMNWQTYLDRKVSAEMKIENKKKKKKGRRNN
tara:strand:+ start:94 stop:465 length:372 start_codon:yes stop_codon:yes gene_type:complete